MKRQTEHLLKTFIIFPTIIAFFLLSGCATNGQNQRDNRYEADTRAQNLIKAKAERARRDAARRVQTADDSASGIPVPEVRNLNVVQSGDKVIATYDLVGTNRELEAEVSVSVTINGERRTAETLSLEGDLGDSVRVGPGKMIIWNAMADLPSDFDGEFSWDVTAATVSASPKSNAYINSPPTPVLKNLRVGQSGDDAVATYDLVGADGVQEAEVIVAVIIDGDRRSAESLSLSGDFGKGVKVGLGKKIIWNAKADLPANFDGELSWDLKVVNAPESAPRR
jgi:archaellum component FlaG (FlaF/FlaG flagellin family)